ncbi:hypothetical protein MLD38_024181 [Melastoma candidum]|uniref:Uncharacterized protein n=1 Tax=Melastoma candidum TaxID=119954 RepID=A0ACB9NUX5_9MYRT|nr:hypothetical protein MLD38_024181 [Melastoma candidum]
MSTTFYTCADAFPVFLQERYIFMRETAYKVLRSLSLPRSPPSANIPPPHMLRHHLLCCGPRRRGFLFYCMMMLTSF